ncbi:MAG: hypothetical protein ACO2PM_11180 [Pyrobaculum sp.]
MGGPAEAAPPPPPISDAVKKAAEDLSLRRRTSAITSPGLAHPLPLRRRSEDQPQRVLCQGLKSACG